MTASPFLFLAFLGNLSLGVYAYLNNPKKLVNRIFGIFVLFISIWIFLNFLISVHSDVRYIDVIGRAAWAVSCFLVLFLVLFFCVFPGRNSIPLPRGWLVALHVPPVLFSALAFTDAIQKGVLKIEDTFRPLQGPLFPFYAGFMLVYIVGAAWVAVARYRRTKDPFEKLQFKYVFLGFFLLSAISAFTLIVLPMITHARYVMGIAPSSSIITIAFFAYAIIKYRLMDISFLYRSLLIYLSIAISYALILLLAFHLHGLIHTENMLLADMSFAFLVALFLSLLYGPMKIAFQEVYDRYVFHHLFNYQKELKEIGKELARLNDLRSLAKILVRKISGDFRLGRCFLIVFQGPDVILEEDQSEESEKARIDFRKLKEHFEHGDIPGAREILIREELKRRLDVEEFQRIDRIFLGLRAEVLIPLWFQDRLTGLLGLGRKRSGEVFSAEDIRFLLMVSNQIVIALENARLFSEILEVKNYNEMLLSQMASGVVSVDPDLVITTCNPRASEILGLGEPIVGKKAELLPREISELLVKALQSEETTSNQEVWIKNSEGQFRCLNCSTSVLFERPGKKLGAMIIFNDLTRIKILEEEVKRAERLATVGTLAAGVAHEIKNPLVSLKTFAQLLPMKFDDMEFRNSFTKIAINEVERINNLVEKLLHFARPTRPDFHIYSMNRVIEDTIQLIQAQLDNRSISLEVVACGEQCMGYGDKEQIGQVLLNLLLNAIQAVEDRREDARIEIRLEREGDSQGILLPHQPPEGFQMGPHFLKVTVKDNGKGISSKDLPRIFDPFFTTKPKGHGLGLSIAHKIVQDHYGKIQVESEPNQYTEISIYLPEVIVTNALKETEDEVLLDRI